MEKGSRIGERNIVAIKNWTCNQIWESIYKDWSPRTVLRMIFLSLNLSIFIFLSPKSSYLLSNLLNPSFFNPLSTNSLYWVFLAQVHPPGEGSKLCPYINNIKYYVLTFRYYLDLDKHVWLHYKYSIYIIFFLRKYI